MKEPGAVTARLAEAYSQMVSAALAKLDVE